MQKNIQLYYEFNTEPKFKELTILKRNGSHNNEKRHSSNALSITYINILNKLDIQIKYEIRYC